MSTGTIFLSDIKEDVPVIKRICQKMKASIVNGSLIMICQSSHKTESMLKNGLGQSSINKSKILC